MTPSQLTALLSPASPYGIIDYHHEPPTPCDHLSLSPEPLEQTSFILVGQRRIRRPGLADQSTKRTHVIQYEPGLTGERTDDAARRTFWTV